MTSILLLAIVNSLSLAIFLCIHYLMVMKFKHIEDKYAVLFDDYTQQGFFLDRIALASRFLSHHFVDFKILFFIRLYRGVKMKEKRNKYVDEACYRFMQDKPKSEVQWMLDLYKYHLFSLCVGGLFFLSGTALMLLEIM
ncbi:hypothetical protein [Pantoea sp. A4]|uniref:hypothetical protein n=1 Tax=Pantoea sp. A4 TaxID=1225184 RepID=UPI0003745CE7|nr:hypothetical protein [Pantoea sp. A4]